ncbi:MAG TPA: hypothetical protein VGI90_07715 [Steroidobacteraceae bacterium]
MTPDLEIRVRRPYAQLRATLSCIALAWLATGAVWAEEQSLPGLTYASIQSLPRWSGWWILNVPPLAEFQRQPPPMKPADLAKFRALRLQNVESDPTRWCRPPQFVGYSGGFVEDVEFLFTPGRVTLTNESGLIRRIYTDGRSTPRDLEENNTGTSIGHWEGETLVVETVGINPDAQYPDRGPGSLPIGKHVRVTERIVLKDENTLEFDVTLIAPDILTAPDRRRRIYSRAPKQIPREVSFCVGFDRSIDPVTGKQRFDTTPPKDLPPPPRREP